MHVYSIFVQLTLPLRCEFWVFRLIKTFVPLQQPQQNYWNTTMARYHALDLGTLPRTILTDCSSKPRHDYILVDWKCASWKCATWQSNKQYIWQKKYATENLLPWQLKHLDSTHFHTQDEQSRPVFLLLNWDVVPQTTNGGVDTGDAKWQQVAGQEQQQQCLRQWGRPRHQGIRRQRRCPEKYIIMLSVSSGDWVTPLLEIF